jgi:hypothetical membrane protein
LIGIEKEKTADILVQGGVAIAAGIIFFAALFLPWLSIKYTAISGMAHAEDQAAVVIPMTLILLAVLESPSTGGTLRCIIRTPSH